MLVKIKSIGVFRFINIISDIIYSEILRLRYGYGTGFRISRNSEWIGGHNIRVGKGFRMRGRCRIETISSHLGHDYYPKITIGDFTALNDDVHIGCVGSINIGNNVLMASKIFISDHNHGTYAGTGLHNSPEIAPNLRPLGGAGVVIGDNVWIGEMVTILPGVSIGRGSIIGAGSIVTRDIPADSIAVGNPARIVKKYSTATNRWERTDVK